MSYSCEDQMLGELILESKGRITSQRVLSVENGIPKLEILDFRHWKTYRQY